MNCPNVVTFFPTIETSVSRGIEMMEICLVAGSTCQIMMTSLRWPPTWAAVPYVVVPDLSPDPGVGADHQHVERLACDLLLLRGDVHLLDLVVAVARVAVGPAHHEEGQHHQGHDGVRILRRVLHRLRPLRRRPPPEPRPPGRRPPARGRRRAGRRLPRPPGPPGPAGRTRWPPGRGRARPRSGTQGPQPVLVRRAAAPAAVRGSRRGRPVDDCWPWPHASKRRPKPSVTRTFRQVAVRFARQPSP